MRCSADFNPRSPDGERRTCVPPSYFDDIFQSTLPGWGATPAVDFIDPLTEISIHAPRMGSDTSSWSMTRSSTYFNPRSPDGERQDFIYIHYLRRYFNPRSPDGERHEATMYPLDSTAFQSTLPGWGATRNQAPTGHHNAISIHAPRMGSDKAVWSSQLWGISFQSTLPGWGATTQSLRYCLFMGSFQSTLPGWGATTPCATHRTHSFSFQSTLPGWGATEDHVSGVPKMAFQSTLPGWGATRRCG